MTAVQWFTQIAVTGLLSVQYWLVYTKVFTQARHLLLTEELH